LRPSPIRSPEAFEKQGKDIKDLTDSVAHIVKQMAAKSDIGTLQGQVNSIERQLRETKTEIRLGNLEEKVFGEARR
jgi:hypothetical protein